MKSIYTCLFLTFTSLILGQSFQEDITTQLAAINMSIFSPIEQNEYKLKEDHSKYFPATFIINHPDKLDVRVEIFSYPKDSTALANPHVQNGMRLGQIMNNLDDSTISMHRLGSEDLKFYGADWATQATFHPRIEFSNKRHCQLITIYKEEVGMVYLYLLFDDLDKYQDDWRYLLGFQNEVIEEVEVEK